MKPKFKIGDRVKLKGFNEIWIIHRIDLGLKDGYANYHLSEDKINSINIANAKCNELKLVETSEEIAIKKFKEELKDKIKKLNYSLDIRDKMPYKQKVYLEEILELIDK